MKKIVQAALKASMLAVLGCPAAVAQAADQSGPVSEPGFHTPHTGWGVPDLQGFWTNTSFTAMQRPPGASKLVLTEQEAAALAKHNVYSGARREEAGASKVDEESSKKLLSDANPSRGYNTFWMDPGASYAMVKGEYRSSWITSPADGHIPYTDRGIKTNVRSSGYDGPESRPQSERCIMSFTGGFGPVLNNGMYNNTYQIVQSPTSVMILAEMIHDARIIPIAKSKADVNHGSSTIPKWGGDSVGWYEGDTLVVETVNPHPTQRSFISSTGKVTERFSRWSDKQVYYQFSVEDPTLYKTSWSGEMSLNTSKEPLYEYACH